MKNKLLIYHDRCPDGFGSRWAFETLYGDNMEYIPMNYGDPITFDVNEKDVFIADFSFSRPVIEKMHSEARSFQLLDHHITAERDLYDLPYCKIDKTKSGAVLSWMFTRGVLEEDVPEILKFIQDRDIWNWSIKDSDKFLSALDSHPFDTEKWTNFSNSLSDESKRSSLLNEGEAIQRYKEATVRVVLKKKHPLMIDGNKVWACNVTHLHSDVAAALIGIEGNAIGCTYHFDGKKYIISLRSDKKNETVDVSLLAGKFGGGGHKSASAFTASIEQFVKFLNL